MKKLISLVTALLLAVCLVPTAAFAAGTNSAAKNSQSDKAWENNILITEPFKVFGIDEETIGSVTFYDNLDNAPKRTWYVGKGGSSSVRGWITWEGGYANIHFAAEGGINAEACCEDLFKDLTELVAVNFNGAFHTEYAECMDDMFMGCEELEELDLSSFDTANVTSMTQMFKGCEELEKLDLSSFDTSKVTSMYEMFRDCKALEELDVSKFNTSEVTTMYCMFSTCTELEELDLSSFDTSNVTNMGFMFSACRKLERVNVSSFDTSRVYNMEGMFRWCNELEEPDLSGWKVSRVINYSNFMNSGMRINGKPWEKFFE